METAGKKIVKFLKASNELEQYLPADGSLTPLEHQTIETTIMGLLTLLESWTRKHRGTGTSVRSRLTPRKVEES